MMPEDILKQIPTDSEAMHRWFEENYQWISVSSRLTLNGVSKDETLRRYVDLPKLFDLLKNKRLVLPRLKQLIDGDPSECFVRKKFDHLSRPELEQKAKQLKHFAPGSARRLETNPLLIFSGTPSRFERQINEMTDDELREAVWYLEQSRLKQDLVCSCWHRGTVESDAMWKIYAALLGVAVSTSVARMESSLQLIAPKILAERTELHLAAVHYEDTTECGNHEPWLVKRKAFDHEKEVRLYCDVPFAYGTQFEVGLDLATFIDEIVITPFATEWQVAGIQSAIEALLNEVGAGQIIVRQSKHMQAPQIVWPPDRKPKTIEESFDEFIQSQAQP